MSQPPNGPNGPRLSESQKKRNHIISEQKRREAIRQGFDRLSEIVPGMRDQGRSEALMLNSTVAWIKTQLAVKERLWENAQKQGMSKAQFEQVYDQVQKAVKEEDELGQCNGEGSARRRSGSGSGNLSGSGSGSG